MVLDQRVSIDDATGYPLIGSSGFPPPRAGCRWIGRHDRLERLCGTGAGVTHRVGRAPNLVDRWRAGRSWRAGVDNVTGSEPLGIDVSNHGILWLGLIDLNTANVAVGDVTVTGADPADTGTAAYRNGAVAAGKDGDTLNSATEARSRSWTLPVPALHRRHGHVQWRGDHRRLPTRRALRERRSRSAGHPDGEWLVTLDSASALQFEVAGPGSTAGTDYSQLNATGPVALGGAALDLTGSDANGSCPTVEPGTVETLVTTSGTLSGVLGNAAPGSIVPLDCDWPHPLR